MKKVKVNFRGFPGWHIECSAMSTKYLGEQFDIHTGGMDLIPVHHTNEIAQSECAWGKKPWVNYWLHNEFLVNDKGKMAKSSGEFLTLQTLLDKGYDSLDYRYFLMTGNYRQQLQFSWEAMDSAKQSRERLMNIIDEIKEGTYSVHQKELKEKGIESMYAVNPEIKDEERKKSFQTLFKNAINNDLNMPEALATSWNVLRDPWLGQEDKLFLVEDFDKVLGLRLMKEPETKKVQIGADLVIAPADIPQEIIALAEQREVARKAKDFAASDKLRDEMAKKGYQINDQKEGYKIRKK
ncbi:hypothetical protein GOV07_02315 [Candidatus Woesearchaeota archaeon]|nr:hypothetical protein [Candidatus Woesearchaeota archaeon]